MPILLYVFWFQERECSVVYILEACVAKYLVLKSYIERKKNDDLFMPTYI